MASASDLSTPRVTTMRRSSSYDATVEARPEGWAQLGLKVLGADATADEINHWLQFFLGEGAHTDEEGVRLARLTIESNGGVGFTPLGKATMLRFYARKLLA